MVIELFPAGNGDAILLDFGTNLILIDCGYVSTYRDYLKPRLNELHEAGRSLTKFIVTHIDADHIQGAIAFIKENGRSDNPTVINIDEVWFNSYRHLYFEDKEEGNYGDTAPSFVVPQGLASIEADDEERVVSFSQGTGLGSLLLKHGYAWNSSFGGQAVMANNPISIPLNNDTTIRLFGPTQQALETLGNRWYTYLKKIFSGKINEDAFFDDAFELMLEEMRQAELKELEAPDTEALVSDSNWVEAYATDWSKEDKSPTNGSSIIFLLEHKNKRLLFLGDAIPSQVVAQLKKLYPEETFPIHVDVLKVAHHGAWYNNSPELIKIISADYFLFSSNGSRHRHPHLQTLAWILKSHRVHNPKTFVFNYKQDRLWDLLEEENLKRDFSLKTKWPETNDFENEVGGYVKISI